MITVVYQDRISNEQINISDLITDKITLISTFRTSSSSLDLECVYGDAFSLNFEFKNGNIILLAIDDDIFFVGYIFKISLDQQKIRLSVFDSLKYLKAIDTRMISNLSLESFINNLSNEFNLTLGTLERTNFVLSTKLFEDKSLLDMIEEFINIVLENTRELFVFYDDKGKLVLKNFKTLKIDYELINIESYVYEKSIEETYNHIIVAHERDDVIKYYQHLDGESIKKYGVLQHYVKVDSNYSLVQVNDILRSYAELHKDESQSLKVTTLFVPLRAGNTLIYDGKYYLIEHCTHIINNNANEKKYSSLGRTELTLRRW